MAKEGFLDRDWRVPIGGEIVEFKEGTSFYDVEKELRKRTTGLTGGFGNSFLSGVESLKGSLSALPSIAFGSVFGSQESVEEAGKIYEETQKAQQKLQPLPTTREEVVEAYEREGITGAIPEAYRFASQSVGQTLPYTLPSLVASRVAGTDLGLTALSAMSRAVPWLARAGAAIPSAHAKFALGTLAGVGTLAVQFLGDNLQRQYEVAAERDPEGKVTPEDLSLFKAALVAGPQASMDFITIALLGGLGRGAQIAASRSVKDSLGMAGATARAATYPSLKAAAKESFAEATLEFPTEMAQTILERAQAGESISFGDAEFINEMMDVVAGTAPVVGVFGGLGTARSHTANKKAFKEWESLSEREKEIRNGYEKRREETARRRLDESISRYRQSVEAYEKNIEREEAALYGQREEIENQARMAKERMPVDPEHVLDVAKSRNIKTDDDAFKSFVYRVTGGRTSDLNKTTQDERSAMRVILSGMTVQTYFDEESKGVSLPSSTSEEIDSVIRSFKSGQNITVDNVRKRLDDTFFKKAKGETVSFTDSEGSRIIANSVISEMKRRGYAVEDDKGNLKARKPKFNEVQYEELISQAQEEGSINRGDYERITGRFNDGDFESFISDAKVRGDISKTRTKDMEKAGEYAPVAFRSKIDESSESAKIKPLLNERGSPVIRAGAVEAKKILSRSTAGNVVTEVMDSGNGYFIRDEDGTIVGGSVNKKDAEREAKFLNETRALYRVRDKDNGNPLVGRYKDLKEAVRRSTEGASGTPEDMMRTARLPNYKGQRIEPIKGKFTVSEGEGFAIRQFVSPYSYFKDRKTGEVSRSGKPSSNKKVNITEISFAPTREIAEEVKNEYSKAFEPGESNWESSSRKVQERKKKELEERFLSSIRSAVSTAVMPEEAPVEFNRVSKREKVLKQIPEGSVERGQEVLKVIESKLKEANLNKDVIASVMTKIGRDGMTGEGSYSPNDDGFRRIAISLDQIKDAKTNEEMRVLVAGIMDHEIIHAMRDLDLFTIQEWNVLSNATYRVRNKDGQTFFERASIDYNGETTEYILEEAVAEMYRQYYSVPDVRRQIAGQPRTLLERIAIFLEKMFNALSGAGFVNAADVISGMKKIQARERGEVRTIQGQRNKLLGEGISVAEDGEDRSDKYDNFSIVDVSLEDGNNNQDRVIANKIDVSKLKRLPGGSTRDAYVVGNKVIKVAKNPRGLQQNASLGYGDSLILGSSVPELFESGKDYIVTENVPRNDKETRNFLKPLKKFSAKDFENKTTEVQEAMSDMGLEGFLNYDLLWADFISYRNWGQRANGDFVLIDEGALNKDVHSTSKIPDWAKTEWEEIKRDRREAKKTGPVVGDGLSKDERFAAVPPYDPLQREHGDPLPTEIIAYHGGSRKADSPWSTTEYLGTGEGSASGGLRITPPLGKGIYFASIKDTASRYLKYGGDYASISEVILDTSNMVSDRIKSEKWKDFRNVIDKNKGIFGKDYRGEDIKPSDIKELFKYAKPEVAYRILKEAGITGVYEKLPGYGDEIAVFDPSVIKDVRNSPMYTVPQDLAGYDSIVQGNEYISGDYTNYKKSKELGVPLGSWQIYFSELKESMVPAFKEFINPLLADGKYIISSDPITSEEAKVWESLAQDGYIVEMQDDLEVDERFGTIGDKKKIGGRGVYIIKGFADSEATPSVSEDERFSVQPYDDSIATDKEAYDAAMTQRGEPEIVMDDITTKDNPGFPARLKDLLMHVGDLSHRAQERKGLGISGLIEKINAIIRLHPSFGNKSIRKEIEDARFDNAERNVLYRIPDFKRLDTEDDANGNSLWKSLYETRSEFYNDYRKTISKEEIQQEIQRAKDAEVEPLARYKQAHQDHNRPVTEMGQLGKEMAIDLAEGKYEDVYEKAKIFKTFLDRYTDLRSRGEFEQAEKLRLKKAQGSGLRGSVPPAPGTAPIPEGHVRFFHYTRASADTIKNKGIDIDLAKGETYKEPNQIWASKNIIAPQKTNVEFSVPSSDPRIGGTILNPLDPNQTQATFTGSISPDEIIAVHEPWHKLYRYIVDSPKLLNEVLDGKHDRLLSDGTYAGRAVLEVKNSFSIDPEVSSDLDNIRDADPSIESMGDRLSVSPHTQLNKPNKKMQWSIPRVNEYSRMDFTNRAVRAFNDERLARAYHGSGEEFDKFSSDFIGAGEGVQVFGWGLYFTDLIDIAEFYRKTVAKPSYGRVEIGGITIYKAEDKPADYGPSMRDSQIDGVNPFVVAEFQENMILMVEEQLEATGGADQAITDAASRYVADEIIEARDDGDIDRLRDWSNLLSMIKEEGSNAEVLREGQVYEVEIPDDSELMDWDAPLSEQPHVVDSLKQVGNQWVSQIVGRYEDRFRFNAEDATASWLYGQMQNSLGSERAASEALAAAGIKGHKYAAGRLSSVATDATNYVIYDDKAISIAKKLYASKRPAFESDERLSIRSASIADGNTKPERLSRSNRRKIVRTEPIVERNIEQILDTLFAKNNPNESLFEKIKSIIFDDEKRKEFITRFRSAFLDKYDYISKVSKKAALKNKDDRDQLASTNAHALWLLADRANSIVSGGINNGTVVLKGGIARIDPTKKSLRDALSPLFESSEDLYRHWATWMVANRSTNIINRSGMLTPLSEEEINRVNDYTLKSGNLEMFESVRRDYEEWNGELVKFLKDTGVINDQLANIFTKYADYIPFYRNLDLDGTGVEGVRPEIFKEILEKEGVDLTLGSARRLKTLFPSLTDSRVPAKMKGGEQQLDDPLTGIMKNLRASVTAGMKNLAAQQTMKDAVDSGIAKEVFADEDGYVDPSYYTIRVNGEERYFDVSDPLLVAAIEGFTRPTVSTSPFFAAPATWLRESVARSPIFMFRNLFRDSISTYVNSGVDMTPVVDTMNKFIGDLRGEKSGTYSILENAGIVGGYDYVFEPKKFEKQFRDKMRKQGMTLKKGSFDVMPAAFSKIWDSLGEASQASDAATRQVVYEDTLQNLLSKGVGRSEAESEAIFQAMEVLNFTRKGNNAFLNLILPALPFFNARMQGLDVVFRASQGRYSSNKLGRDEARASFLRRGMFLAALTGLVTLMSMDDEEYKGMTGAERDDNWLITLPLGLNVKIPIPFEVGFLFKVIPEHIMRTLFGNESLREARDAIVRGVVNSFEIPATGPQAVAPVFEVLINKSWFTGRPIVPEYMQDRPTELQAKYYTSEFAKQISYMSGGLASPLAIEHILMGYSGTMGSYALGLLDSAASLVSGKPIMMNWRQDEIPLVGAIFQSSNASEGQLQRWNDFFFSVRGVVAGLRDLEQEDPERARAVREKYSDVIAIKSSLEAKQQRLNDLRSRKTRVYLDKTMEDSQKRAIIDNIDNSIKQILDDTERYTKMLPGPVPFARGIN